MTPTSPESLAWLDSLQGSGIRPGLQRMKAMLRALGSPEKAIPAVIVGGTNGKGSTSAMIASIAHAAGYRTAHYTSPHLVDIRERWAIDGEPVSQELLDVAVAELRRASARTEIVPTYFEALTLVAFVVFRLARCGLSVLEVGMGGRLDATNVVHPLASVIAPISFDHMEYLGRTLRQIASEKAGIIHRGAVVLTSNDDERVLAVLRKRAVHFGCPFHVITGEHPTPLEGDFQRRNAALAVATARALHPHFPRITDEAIERGTAQTRWLGRLQRLERGGKAIWIDGAHNAHAARAIAPFISERVAAPRTLVFGVMADKDFAPVTEALFPLFDEIVTTEPFPPRSASAGALAALAESRGLAAAAEPDPAAAFRLAMRSPARSIVIAGSLYLAGAAISFFD